LPEGFVISIYDEVISTNFKKYAVKENISGNRWCVEDAK
jgi:hypothetical protein